MALDRTKKVQTASSSRPRAKFAGCTLGADGLPKIYETLGKHGPVHNGIAADNRESTLRTAYWAERYLGFQVALIRGNTQNPGQSVFPSYGFYSHIARASSFYVYNTPRLKKLCMTAFTDGHNFWFNERFMAYIAQQEIDSQETQVGMRFLIRHEIYHKAFFHVGMFNDVPKNVLNRAFDRQNNARQMIDFPNEKPVPALTECGIGFLPGQAERDAEKPILLIIDEEMQIERKKPKPDQQPGQGGTPQKGQGQPGSGGSSQPQQGSPDAPGEGEPSDGGFKPSDLDGDGKTQEQFGGDGDDHVHTMEDVSKALREDGLDDFAEGIGYPDPNAEDFEEQIAERNAAAVNTVKDLANRSMREAMDAEASGFKYPGSGTLKTYGAQMKDMSVPLLSWKMDIRRLMFGVSRKRFIRSPSTVAPISYSDDYKELMGGDAAQPGLMTQKSNEAVIWVIDQSGSMTEKDIYSLASEGFGLTRKVRSRARDSAAEVIIALASIGIDGGTVAVTEKTINKVLQAGFGRTGCGGTDIKKMILDALALPELKKKEVKLIVIATDLGDTPPKYKDLGLPKDVKVVYIATPDTPNDTLLHWQRETSDYAVVHRLEKGVVVDLKKVGKPAVRAA